jgi:hypothetical protein
MSTLLQAIRHKCLDCSGGSVTEVRLCHLTKCPLWPYRMGRNPDAKPRGRSYPKPNGSSEKLPLFAGISGGKQPSAGNDPTP